MGLFVLAETSAGYGLFKATDKKLLESENLFDRLSTADKIVKELKYKEFAKFDSAAAALAEINSIVEGTVTPTLSGLLEEIKNDKKISLAVSESKLGNAILKLPGSNIKPIANSSTQDLFRAIRSHLADLVPGMTAESFQEMSLGLAHSLSRHKVKFSPDKVDVMIVHAVSLLDDLDKELNGYAMRVKEWYGWHFPELAKILPDNLSYARIIISLGLRTNAPDADLSEILPHEIETAVKAAADISMGTEISEEDLENIRLLAENVVRYSEYRKQLAEYLETRMRAIAPNLTELVGPLVGARLIAHAKSLMNLAKNPGSTIQILGAEKALFRALKTKHNTPKYGLIYHASLVGQASGQNKGKMARQLASKVALGVRTDALTEWDEGVDEEQKASLGLQARIRLENNLRRLEGKPLSKGVSVDPNGILIVAPAKWNLKEARKYNGDADGLFGDESAAKKRPLIEEVEGGPTDGDAADEAMADAPNGHEVEPRPNSPLLASVSDDTDGEVDESTEGLSKEEKRAKKKERKAQEKRRSEREERRAAKKAQDERRAARAGENSSATPAAASKELSEAEFERLAKLAGMKVNKFKKRFERGQVKLKADGTLKVLSRKAADEGEASTPEKPKSSKRKHDAEEEAVGEGVAKEEKPQKKKKKKHSKE